MMNKGQGEIRQSRKAVRAGAAFCSAVMGVVGTLVWKKKDLLKAAALLGSKARFYVRIQKDPEVYLTKNNGDSQSELFAYLSTGPWRLVDQVADGYFWMNAREEILLLTRKPVLIDKYCTWTASRSFEVEE